MGMQEPPLHAQQARRADPPPPVHELYPQQEYPIPSLHRSMSYAVKLSRPSLDYYTESAVERQTPLSGQTHP
jgi:hypothetical protein